MSSPSESRPGSPSPEDGRVSVHGSEERDDAPVTNQIPEMDDDDLSENDSILSDVDEAQFEDFDPSKVAIDRPAVLVHEGNLKLIGRHKRKRDGEQADEEGGKKKKKDGKRDRSRKSGGKNGDDDDDDFSGGQEVEGKRIRKKKSGTEGGNGGRRERTRARKAPLEDEESLTPEERRRRALDKAMDEALKNPSKRRRRTDGIDVTTMIDEEIASMRNRMSEAAELDVEARGQKPPRPAMYKLRLLPEVTSLLNRNSRDYESAIVDPENNLLEAVRFFLEPLSDGSLPAYNIQRELFACLARLPIDKEALISSGIGKVVLFYTKSKRPEQAIKRVADKLLVEWTRPILNRTDNYRKRVLQTVEFDPIRLALRNGPNGTQSRQISAAEAAAQARERALAPPVKNPMRAKIESVAQTYKIVPKSSAVNGGMFARPLGASGEDAFRKMKARQAAQTAKGPRR